LNRSLRCTLIVGILFSTACTLADEPKSAVDRLFDPQHLVDVQITIDEEDWDDVRLPTRSFFDALQNVKAESPFKYRKATVTIDGVVVKDVGIRKKGFLGSLDTDRPSLKIRFDKYVDQAPFGDLDRLTLNNNKQDPSRLSQYLSYKLFNESGTVASRCNFAKVTVNGRSLGIYANVESVKPAMLKRGFGDGSGALFEGTLADFHVSHFDKFEPKNDKAKTENLRAIAELLQDENLDLEKLDSLIDVDAFVKFWVMESLIGFWDGYGQNQNNFFIYLNPKDSKFYFLPWGTDSAFTYFLPPGFGRIGIRSVHHQSVLCNRLYHHAATRKLYRKTLEDILSKHWNEESMLAEIDRVESMLKDEIHESNKKFASSTNQVRRFVKGRRSIVERELKRWPIEVTIGPREPMFAKLIGHGKAKITTEWYSNSPSKPETRGNVEIELTMNDKPITFKQIGAVAQPNQDRNLPNQNGRRPPSINLTGVRSDGKQITYAMGFDASLFQPSRQPVKAFGVVIEGSMVWFVARAVMNPMSLTFVDVQAKFDEAGMEPGDPVRGELELRILKFAGGKSPTVRWKKD